MTTYNRQQLEIDVDRWLNRDDVAVDGDDIDTIFVIAESYIATEVRCLVQEVSLNADADDRYYALPANFLGMRHVFSDTVQGRIMEYRTPEALREAQGWASGRAGAFYTIEGNPTSNGYRLVLANAPTVAAPLNLDMLYFARFAALTEPEDTNWLVENHYDVYLYSLLRAAAETLEDTELEDRYETKCMKSIARVAKNENRKRFPSGPKQAYGSPRTVV